MASKKSPVHGKSGKMARLMDLAKKGSDLWNEYGDVVKKGVVSIVKKGSSSETDATLGISASLGELSPEEQPVVVHTAENIDREQKKQGEVITGTEGKEKDTFFEDQQSRLYDVVVKETIMGGQLTNPQQCLAALNEIYSVADETIRYCEEQETKREEIRAERDVAIAKIKEMGELVKVYLEKTYDERLAIFTKQFEAIDAAIDSGNVEMLAVTLNSMNALASSSPFKNLADISSVQQGLIEQSEWDI